MCHCMELLLSFDNQIIISFVFDEFYTVSPDILTNLTCLCIVWPRYIRGLQYQSCVLHTDFFSLTKPDTGLAEFKEGGTFVQRMCICVCAVNLLQAISQKLWSNLYNTWTT